MKDFLYEASGELAARQLAKNVFITVSAELSGEDPGSVFSPELEKVVANAIVELTYAGQRDPSQIRRYALSQANAYLGIPPKP